MIQPEELKKNEPLLWSAGTGTDVWELFCACVAGNLETVQRMVTRDPSLVRSHYEYRTPLYFAVRENRMAVAAYLLECGADPFYNGNDLLDIVRDRGYVEMEHLLQSKHARVSDGGDSKKPSKLLEALMAIGAPRDIWAAASIGDVERVRELLDEDPSLINRVADRRSGPPLVLAAGKGHLDVVRVLLERGADPNLPEEGNAPHGRALYSAVYRKHFEVAKLLLEHGAYPNQEVESSADAPSIAIMNSDRRMIELLASDGATWRIPVQIAGA